MKKLLTVALVVAVAAAVMAIPALAATKSVKVGDNYFVHAGKAPILKVKRGTTVRWVWSGHAPHNVRVVSGPARFGSAVMTRGSFSKRLTKKGTYKLVCTIHQPSMAMTVKVS
jgi:plastocyanin